MRFVEAKSFQRWANLVLCFGFALSFQALNFPVTCQAQETEMQLQELQDQWKEIDKKLNAKEAQIKAVDGDPTTLTNEYNALVKEAEGLIEKIEEAAKAKLLKNPNDGGVLRTLMGIMLNDARNGRDAKVMAMGDLLIQQGINSEYFDIASKTVRPISAREMFDELLIRQKEALAGDLPRVKLVTTQGDIVLELFENEAPWTVGNFINLVEKGTYTDTIFHRVIEGFMAQGGGFKVVDGEEVGGKGPGYEIYCECDKNPDMRLHFTGSLSMAHRGKDTGGAQFFLTFERTSGLDGGHTCFGRVIEGQRVLETLTRTHIARHKSPTGREEPIPNLTKDKIISAEVIRKRDHLYRPNRVGKNDVEDVAKEEAAIAAAKKKAAEEAMAKAKAEKEAAEKAAAEKMAAEKAAAEKAKKEAAEAKAKAEKEAAMKKEAAEKEKEASKKEASKKEDDKDKDGKDEDKN